MPYLERLIALKKESDLTNADISKLSDIPLATVTRIFNGHTPNPTFETFARIAIALGASLDEIAGLKQPDALPIDTHIGNTLVSYAELLKEKDERIKELKEEKAREHKEKIKLLIFLLGFVATVMLILVFDLLNGHMGYVRY